MHDKYMGTLIKKLCIRKHNYKLHFHVPLRIFWKSPLDCYPTIGNQVYYLAQCDTQKKHPGRFPTLT